MRETARVERDFKGHFICAPDCQWFRTTDVGGYRVSTIGDYRPSADVLRILKQKPPIEIGFDRLYETMVFRLGKKVCGCGCGAPKVASWSELDGEGCNTAEEAEAGHERMVARYMKGAPDVHNDP